MAADSMVDTANGTVTNSNGIHPASIGHFGLRTTPESFEKMVEWHLNFFNGEAVLKNDHAAFLRFDDEHHRLVIVADPGHKMVTSRRAACGIYHIAFTLATLNDLAISYEEKKALGILPHWPVNHGMSTSMYYFDPDGNEFEMQVDNFATAKEAHEFMSTAEYMSNPIGVDFVPEDFVRRVRSGESEEDIKKRPIIGERPTRWENSIYFKPEQKWDD